MPCADFHCHLEHPDFDADRAHVVKRAVDAGVHAMLTAGSGRKENERVLSLCKQFPQQVYAVIGTSPHHSSHLTQDHLSQEISFVKSHANSIAGIGEVGLDRHHFSKESEFIAQERCFRAYAELAEEIDVPLVVHSRKAEEEVFRVLADYPSVRVMLHCFLVSRLAGEASSRGWLVSLPTVKSTQRVKIAKALPLSRLACETDAPFLWKDEKGNPARNEPFHVLESYQQVAQAKGKDVSEVQQVLWETFHTWFVK